MDAKLSVSIVLLALAAMLMPVFAVASDCPDGTLNWKCSVVNPGERCVNGAPQITANPAPSPAGYGDKPYQFCPCSDIAGWTYNAAQDRCIKTSCTLGSVTKLDTQCFDASKPKYCDAGTVVDKASACGCPAGEQAAGDSCTPISGYCTTDEDCGTPTKKCKDNTCVDREDCRVGKPFCLPSSEECKLTDTGYKCVRQESSSGGNDQPSEPDNQYLNQLGDNNSTGTSGSSAGGLACCAPAAGMILIGAFAFSRKQKK